MSQSRNTLQEKLRKKLEAVKSEEPETDWLCDLVEWLYQEMLEMEFTEHTWARVPTNEQQAVRGTATATGNVSCTHEWEP